MLQGEHSAILSTFILSYHLLLRSLFCLFWSDRFTQVLLFCIVQCSWRNVVLGADVLHVVPMTLLTVGVLPSCLTKGCDCRKVDRRNLRW